MFDNLVDNIVVLKRFLTLLDNALKKEICFSETLVISCAHCDGNIGEESSDSDWTCEESTESDVSVQVKDDKAFEIKDRVEEETVAEENEEEPDDFQFYFFPDCSKPPPPKDSKVSVIIVDGLPKINPIKALPDICTCKKDKKGKCTCFIKVPCKCGAKTMEDCTCKKDANICLCHDLPEVECTCKPSDVCVCPDDKPHPICTCHDTTTPCICHPEKFPHPVCSCEHKPTFLEKKLVSITMEQGGEGEEMGQENDNGEENQTKKEPCECQKIETKPICTCVLGEKCICEKDTCICEMQRTCVCDKINSLEPLCKDADSTSICVCPLPKECTCNFALPQDCSCFAKKLCTCGDPENCKCQLVCNCVEPCICDTQQIRDECLCLHKLETDEKPDCTCKFKIDDGKKLKRVRAGKHGYRWCHDVDPRHTYFGYGYGRHDKISYKEQEREKLKILGLYTEEEKGETCPNHEINAPLYVKKVRKPSIDCCSAVGGINICVETLGEDKDKFLVQVVSHSSKEGAKTGSKLVGILDCNLHTLEENRSEYITKKDITKERRSYMAICESGYYNKVTRICGERHVVKRFYHTFEDAKNFLLEGANIVILRYFGLRRYRGTIKTETVLMDGTICENIYVSLGVSQAIVNGRPLFVVKVERHIIEPCGYIHQTLTVLTLRGYVVSHEWADNSYVLHLNPLLRIIPEKDEIEIHEPIREKWREDLQLLSDYLDYKSTQSSEGARYVTENGALTGTVRDYLQALLLLKPQDAIHFTRHYFGAALSALDLPHNEYFDSSTRHVRYFFFED